MQNENLTNMQNEAQLVHFTVCLIINTGQTEIKRILDSLRMSCNMTALITRMRVCSVCIRHIFKKSDCCTKMQPQ